jgi:hypothetical protein
MESGVRFAITMPTVFLIITRLDTIGHSNKTPFLLFCFELYTIVDRVKPRENPMTPPEHAGEPAVVPGLPWEIKL